MHAVDRKDAMPQSYRTGAVRGAAHARVTPLRCDVGALRRLVMSLHAGDVDAVRRLVTSLIAGDVANRW
jgi:hypothetical protein